MAVAANCDRCMSAPASYSLSNMGNGDTLWLCVDCLLSSVVDIFEAVRGPIPGPDDTPGVGDTPAPAPAAGGTGTPGAALPHAAPGDAPGVPDATAGGDDGAAGVPDGPAAAPPPAGRPKTRRRTTA